MNKVLLIIGIVIIIAGVLSLAFAALNMLGYHRALDGSNEFYARLHQRMIAFGITGIILTLAGAACIIIRSKL